MTADSREAPFACQACGTCCRWPGHVLLTRADIARLAAGLGQTDDEFIQRHTRLASNRAGLSLCEQAGGACEFLDGDRCAVYAFRPDQCRSFPNDWRVDGCPADRA